MGKKYIIELEEPEMFDDRKFYTCSQMPWWAVSENIVENLAPYTEPDTEKVREEAYEDGYKTAKVQCNIQAEKDLREVGERHYQKGLSDAWEAARKIALMDTETSENVTGYFGLFRIMENLTPMQAIEKIRQYEQEKEEQIQVGDEVKAFERKPFIVTGFGYGDEDTVYCHGFVTENGISTIAKKDECVKTGRHFPEIAEVLARMKEES